MDMDDFFVTKPGKVWAVCKALVKQAETDLANASEISEKRGSLRQLLWYPGVAAQVSSTRHWMEIMHWSDGAGEVTAELW